MRTTFVFISCGIVFGFIATSHLRADQLEMQNGDRYFGKVLSVSMDTVVLQSEVLGKINVPRKKVATLAFGTNAASLRTAGTVAPVSVLTNLPDIASLSALTKTGTDLSAARRNLSANTDLVRQVRDQMLAGNPEVAGKYDELVSGFMTGKLNLNDIRREAKSSTDQLRALKRELGPEVGDSLDVYLEVLEGFLKETATTPASTAPVLQSKTQVH